jgi:hypothetical protein
MGMLTVVKSLVQRAELVIAHLLPFSISKSTVLMGATTMNGIP